MTDNTGVLDYRLQVSIKHGPNLTCMTNVRASTAEELEDLLADLVGRGPDIAAACEALGAVATLSAAMPGSQVVNSPGQTGSRAQEFCPHGPMAWKETNDYAGHFCSAKRDDPTRCKARYVKQGGK